MSEVLATGKVVEAYGNLLHVLFEGNIRQGEVGLVLLQDMLIACEVLEIDGNRAKMQVFEDTSGITLGSRVEYTGRLLEAELGPGLLQSIFDGLQNPLEKVAEKTGFFLSRGVRIPPLDRLKKWDYLPLAKVGDVVERGDSLGEVMEGQFHHLIMVPFLLYKKYTLTWVAPKGLYSIEEVIAKGLDEKGKELSFTLLQRWPVKMPLSLGKKVKPSEMMHTGLRIIDTQFPVLKGGTFCTPGPFGAGKTVLQHHLSRYSDVDIVIIAACGERAGEVVEILREFPHLIDSRTSNPLMERTVIICNTSSMPVAAREASVYIATTIGEYYRQMGLEVLVLADSTSRWAQAMREMSGRLEEIPGEEAYPAYLASRIAAFYERSGVLSLPKNRIGSLTIGGAVSPAGGNFEEPVTQATLTVVGVFLGLSRMRSDARRYPAIDPLISWTKYLPQVDFLMKKTVNDWEKKVELAEEFLQEGNEIEKRMEVVGEEGTAIEDMIKFFKGELYDACYLQQNAFDKEDCFCREERQLELFMLIQKIFLKKFSFDSHDEARSFFLEIQDEIRNLNYMPFRTEHYQEMLKQVEEKIEGIRL
ncbi:MAG: V-type ATP synthase subunit A [Chlamydiota bacterium]